MIRSRIPLFAALLAAALLGPAAAQAGEYYKWTRADGSVEYGSKPPEGVQAASVHIDEGIPADQEDELARRQQRLDNAAAAEKLAEAKKAGTVAADAGVDEYKERCARFQANLDTLLKSARVQTKGPDGKARIITEEERQKELEKARAELQKCQELGIKTPAPAAPAAGN
jgi:hypothetical protein